MLLPVEGWPRTRIFLAGIEREEETELRMVDQRSCGGASGEDERESSFIVKLVDKCERVRVGHFRSSSNLQIIIITTALNSIQYKDILMAAAVAVPEHKLSESPNSRAIEIFDWTVTAQTGPISNATHSDELHAALGIPLPEMTFGSNLLQITHRPTGWSYAFRAEDALKGVKNGPLGAGDGGVKVVYADSWLKSR